jgi:putative NADH-flavin reductase
MKIIVFGSTGGTGRLIVDAAVRRGHEVTAFARQAAVLSAQEGLTGVVEGDGRDQDAVERAVVGQQAVIMSVRGNDGESDVAAGIARAVTTAMSMHGVSRLVATSAYGLIATRPYVLASLVRRVFRNGFADQRNADDLIAATALAWTIVRATRLTTGPAKRPPRQSTELFTQGPYSVARIAYATALVDLAEGDSHTHRIVNITG